MPEVGILIVDDTVTSQRALKDVLDSEGWRVRIVPSAPEALEELRTGNWNLAIVNIALADVGSPLFAILRDLAQADTLAADQETETAGSKIRVLFLLSMQTAKGVQLALERAELPYAFKPYHLHDFLEKVSELLVESGAIAEPIRSIGGLTQGKRRRRDLHGSRDTRRNAMFASREDYQMTEEEMAEFERQEEEDRKKREKAQRDREHL